MVFPSDDLWLGLVIGNSRYHWGGFRGGQCCLIDHRPHPSLEVVRSLTADPLNLESWRCLLPDLAGWLRPEGLPPELWLASVVPDQSIAWQSYPGIHIMTLEELALPEVYPTLGIDRALALLGAIAAYGAPVLVVDGGTALTFTAADAAGEFAGGAILPGLGLQLQALGRSTAQLPQVQVQGVFPDRWARNTEAAISSGVMYTLLASIRDFAIDWQQRFPARAIVLTGGDGALLYEGLLQQNSELTPWLKWEPDLIFTGIKTIRDRG